MRIHRLSYLAAGAFFAFFPHGAFAAPQILAVVATDAGVPFTCSGGVCEAALTAFCLQRHRSAPPYGTAYMAAAAGDFTLVVTDADGNQRRLPAAGRVAFSQHRGYTAVAARLPEDVLAELGAVSVAIEVGANASLVPEPRIGDPDPLTAEEIALAVGPLRALGTRIVDGSPEAGATRLIATMINMLPAQDRVAAERRASLWRDATGKVRSGSAESLSRARAEYDGCVAAIEEPSVFSLRSCLERQHDKLIRDLNGDFWNADVGS